jgi:hypothetical protein
MSIAEQALSLLDIFPSVQSRSRLENFSSLDLVIGASLPGSQAPLKEAEPAVTENLYSVASRMGRANYEEQAKAEALLNALRQMRAKNAARSIQTSRVLRRS